MEKNFRHEYKFLISPNAARLLKLRLPHIMSRDPHAGPTGQYTIRSLYFDDPNFTAFRDKVDGVDNRTKYRIRCYNGDTSRCRLERKEKKGHLTRKTGQSITADLYKRPKTTDNPDLARFFAWKGQIACTRQEEFSDAVFGPELAVRVREYLEKLIPLYDFCNRFTV